jgi:hypothetical protein
MDPPDMGLPDRDPPDDLDEYLRGDSALSRQYRRESAPAPPHALDRRVLKASREAQGPSPQAQGDLQRARGASPRAQDGSPQAQGGSPYLAPLAFAASVLLSVALVLAIVFGPPAARVDNAPRVIRVAAHAEASPNAPLDRKLRLYSSDPKPARAPSVWLADIAALRRAGRNSEADEQLRRFRVAYPDYSTGDLASRP